MSRVWISIFLAAITLSGKGILTQTKPAQTELAQTESDQPNAQSLTDEQLSVYSAILKSWKDNSPIRLSVQTSPYSLGPTRDPEICEKGLQLEVVTAGETHRFRIQDLPRLGAANFYLSDSANRPDSTSPPEQPPRTRIRSLTLGEIRFDKQHNHAIFQYSYRCGPLCGNGATMLLEKKNGVWRRKTTCSNWIS